MRARKGSYPFGEIFNQQRFFLTSNIERSTLNAAIASLRRLIKKQSPAEPQGRKRGTSERMGNYPTIKR
jgi:hypothetical protein